VLPLSNMFAPAAFAVVALALAEGAAPSPPRSRAARCQLIHAIVGVAHSGARSAFRDLDCVRARTDRRRLLVRVTVTDDAGTRPLLAPGEQCPTDGYVGADPRRLSRSRRPRSFIELRLARRAPDRLSFSVLLETWGSKHDSGLSCGASGEGVVVLEDDRWRERS
jgi:hypothetical protein